MRKDTNAVVVTHPSSPTPTLPCSPSAAATAATLVAFTALYLTSNSFVLPVLACGLLLTHFRQARLQRESSAVWMIRLAAYGTITVFHAGKPGIGADWLLDARTFNTIGLICASEIVIQSWREPPPAARYHAVTILFSGFVFLAACNTFDDRHIRYGTPLYFLLIILSWRDLRLPVASPAYASQSTSSCSLNQTRRWMALCFVVAAGAATHHGIWTYRNELMSWGMQFFSERHLPQTAGMSSQPVLGSTFETHDSPVRVLKIEGPLGDGHLRGMAFDTYSGGRWSPLLDQRKTQELTPHQLRGDKPGPHAHITRLVGSSGFLFSPLNIAGLIPAKGSEVEWDAAYGGPLRTHDSSPYTYEVVLSDEGDEWGVALHQGPLCTRPEPEQHARCLEVPAEIDPRVRALAQRIAGGLAHPAERVEAVTEYLMTHHSYSRSTRRGGGDPVSNFLLQKKSAHCEYFASAAVILLRCVGVPTRYVTGYYAHEPAGTGITVVRQRDAHAWAESWINGVGWITVDATPADGRPDETAPPVPPWRRAGERLQDNIQAARERLATLTRGQMLLLVLAVMVLWLVERWRLSRKNKKPLQEDFSYSSPHQNLTIVARRFEALLQGRGLPCAAGMTWQEHLKALEEHGMMVKEDGTPHSTSEETCEPTISMLDAENAFLVEYNGVRFGEPVDSNAVAKLFNMLTMMEKQHEHTRTR